MTNKKQLIYKEDLIAEYDRVHIGEPGRARKLIADAPTVDAVEVVHGRWSFIGENCCVCSVCHKHAIADYYFCPECGAKMDGDGNG